MRSYRHLTRDDREHIAALKAAGWSQRRIAEAVDKAPSTISRELRRNALDSGRYSAHVADGAYMARRQRPARLERDALEMTTWFCDAYASWQKGGVENANGRLRRWLPRQTNLDHISDEDLQEIVMTYNLTPRKCLGYLTPIQALFKDLGRDVRLRFA